MLATHPRPSSLLALIQSYVLVASRDKPEVSLFFFGGPLLVLSCLGQAADVLASTARSSAFGSTFKATPKLERVQEVSLTPTLIPERTEDEGAAKQDHWHSPGTATMLLRTYRWCDSQAGCLLLPPGGWVGMQVKISS